MSTVLVFHRIGALERDMRAIPPKAMRDMRATVRDGLKAGNTVAKDFAKSSAGAHGKHYHKAFSVEMHGVVSFGGVNGISGEYGPDAHHPGRQGGMSFEFGSRKQKPHLDLAKSADLIGPAFGQEVHHLPDKWFW